MNFSKADKNRLIKFYTNHLQKYGDQSYKTLHWSDKFAQIKRFEVLRSFADLEGQRILDFGCGLGDFYQYLKCFIQDLEYTGIDIVPSFIQSSRKKYPTVEFFNIDIQELGDESYDYVFASGVFSFKVKNYEEIYLSKIKEMYRVAVRGIAFNMLNRDGHTDNWLYATYESKGVYDYCRSISPIVILRDDYLKQDFTIFLGKQAK